MSGRVGVFVIPTPLASLVANLALDHGMEIPEQLGLIGYDYMVWVDRLRIPLTTIQQPIDSLVDETVRVVQTRLAQAAAPPARQTLYFDLVQRAST